MRRINACGILGVNILDDLVHRISSTGPRITCGFSLSFYLDITRDGYSFYSHLFFCDKIMLHRDRGWKPRIS